MDDVCTEPVDAEKLPDSVELPQPESDAGSTAAPMPRPLAAPARTVVVDPHYKDFSFGTTMPVCLPSVPQERPPSPCGPGAFVEGALPPTPKFSSEAEAETTFGTSMDLPCFGRPDGPDHSLRMAGRAENSSARRENRRVSIAPRACPDSPGTGFKKRSECAGAVVPIPAYHFHVATSPHSMAMSPSPESHAYLQAAVWSQGHAAPLSLPAFAFEPEAFDWKQSDVSTQDLNLEGAEAWEAPEPVLIACHRQGVVLVASSLSIVSIIFAALFLAQAVLKDTS